MSAEGKIVIDLKFEPGSVSRALEGAFADWDVVNLNDPGQADAEIADADFAVVWKSRADLFARANRLKAVFSGGAGVDHVLTLPGLPDIPLIRFVDHTLTTRMSEWVVMQALLHLRQHHRYEMQRADRRWLELPQPQASEVRVGIMGMGVLGQDAARKLRMMGFAVAGWSRTGRPVDDVDMFGADRLDEFLGMTDILVGLLPLTAGTRNIFDKALFRKLRRDGALGGPVFINAGRGGSQVEGDLVECLSDGTLLAASLDVFQTEPLPASSPFWSMPNVFMTPHAAAASDVPALIAHVGRQIERYRAGLPFEHVVDRKTGY